MKPRQYFDMTVAQLTQIVESNWSKKEVLSAVKVELSFRSTHKACKLDSQVGRLMGDDYNSLPATIKPPC